MQNRNNRNQESAQVSQPTAGKQPGSNMNARTNQSSQVSSKLSQAQLASFNDELNRTGVTMAAVEKRYKVRSPEEMSPAVYEKVMHALSVTPNAHAA